MEGFLEPTPFSRLVADALGDQQFTLIDVGCSSGIDSVWRAFGDHLKAFAFDPNVAEIERLAARETLPGVKYVAAFVGVPDDTPGVELMQTGNFWARSPWSRLSVARTMQIQAAANERLSGEERTQRNLWTEVPLADPKAPVVLGSFLRDRGVADIDFVKIDVDGADFIILRSLVSLLSETNVLGVGIEVNFHGSDDPDVHTFHNVDRLMKQQGFELFSLSARPYSVAALPAPYLLSMAAQTQWGRLLQGDALYLRDVASPDQLSWGNAIGAAKLLKLAAIFSLAGLPDCGAEVLLAYRDIVASLIDVSAGLDALTAQCVPEDEGPLSYAQYMAEYEVDGIRFWPKRREEAVQRARQLPAVQNVTVESPGPMAHADTELTSLREEVAALKLSSAPARTIDELTRLNNELAALKSSKSWQLTAPLRNLAKSFKRSLSRG